MHVDKSYTQAHTRKKIIIITIVISHFFSSSFLKNPQTVTFTTSTHLSERVSNICMYIYSINILFFNALPLLKTV